MKTNRFISSKERSFLKQKKILLFSKKSSKNLKDCKHRCCHHHRCVYLIFSNLVAIKIKSNHNTCNNLEIDLFINNDRS